MSTSKRGIDKLAGNQPTTNQANVEINDRRTGSQNQSNYTSGRESSPEFPRRSTSLRDRGYGGTDYNTQHRDWSERGDYGRDEDRGEFGRRSRDYGRDYSSGGYGSSGYGGQGRFGGGSYGSERGGPQQYGYGTERYYGENRERDYGRTSDVGGYGHSGEYGRSFRGQERGYGGQRNFENRESRDYQPRESYRGPSRGADYDQGWADYGTERDRYDREGYRSWSDRDRYERDRYDREGYGGRYRDYDVEDVPAYGRDRSAFDQYGVARGYGYAPQREWTGQWEAGQQYGRYQLRCRDIMSKDVTTCTPQTPLREVAEKMEDDNVGSIPIVDNGRLIGIVTDRDIVCRVLAEGRDTRSATAADAMSDDLITCTPDETVLDCIRKMGEHQIRRMLVVDNGGRLRGIISLADIALEAERDRDLAQALEEISRPTPHQAKRR